MGVDVSFFRILIRIDVSCVDFRFTQHQSVPQIEEQTFPCLGRNVIMLRDRKLCLTR